MTKPAAILIVALVTAPTAAQQPSTTPPSVQKLFESGQYDALRQRVAAEDVPPPADLYLAGQAALKIEPPDRDGAKAAYAQIERAGDEQSGWTFIARSAKAVVDHAGDEAVRAAKQAVELAPNEPFAHYQLGLAQGEKRAWADAAEAFEKATTLAPNLAYAHYYAGMSYYQMKRLDRMSAFFERFVKLAPQAPERPAVESLLKTLRGK
jgi:tetratricopeptide (TPR) repeat protein